MFRSLMQVSLLFMTLCCVVGCGTDAETLPPSSSSIPASTNSPTTNPPAATTPTEAAPNLGVEESAKVYTLEDRPAGDWAGHWEGPEGENRYVWIENDLTGFLGLGPMVDLYALEFQKEGGLLRVKQEGEILPYEITRDDSKTKMTFKNTETGEEFECLKQSDPITGIVFENVGRFGALEQASFLSRLLMKDEKEIPYFEFRQKEFRKIVGLHFDSFQEVEVGKYLALTLNSDKTGFDAIRFRTPKADHNWDLFWEFIVESSIKMNGWYILPREGELEGFTGYEHAYNVTLEDVDIPEKNLQIKQSLTGGKLRPDTEYLIWFGNVDSYETPYKLVVRVGFLPAE
jgi:hypothetical protein